MLRISDCGRDGFSVCLLVWIDELIVRFSFRFSGWFVGRITADLARETRLGERVV